MLPWCVYYRGERHQYHGHVYYHNVGIAEVAMVMAGVISAEIMAILRCNSDFSA